MEKKNRPVQQAANSDIRGSDVTPPAHSIQQMKRTPKKHRARVYMLRTGVHRTHQAAAHQSHSSPILGYPVRSS